MIRDYKNGQNVPRWDHLNKLIEVLHTNADYLFDRTDDPHPALNLTADERQFILWWRGFPGEPTAENIDEFLISQHAAKKPRPRSKR